MKKSYPYWVVAMLCVFCFTPVSALAHVGVTESTGLGQGFGHPFGGADHLLAMLAVGVWAAQMGGRSIWAVPSAFLVMVVVGGVLGITGVALPYVEQGILASILVLGVLIAGAFKSPTIVSAAIVGLFAVFHGHAHGSEIPLEAGLIFYTVGFALATTLLHVVGMALGLILRKLDAARFMRLAGMAILFGGICVGLA